MGTNDLGLIATAIFILVPCVFLILLYSQTASRESGNQSIEASMQNF